MKVIFIDVDGTFVDYENTIPDSAAIAVKTARENGHKVYLVSGRSRAEIPPELWDVGFDGLIGGNGCYVESEGETIFHKPISKVDEKEIVDYFNENGIEFYLEANDGLFASDNFKTAALEAVKKYSGNEDVTVEEAFPEMNYNKPLIREGVNKISYLLSDYSDFLRTKEKFSTFKNSNWGGKGHEALFGDITVSGIDKGIGVKKVLDYLGISKSDAVAVGDAKVDLPMIETCGIGVAMGNGEEEVKKEADLITSSVDKNGLYNAFFELGLLKNNKNQAVFKVVSEEAFAAEVKKYLKLAKEKEILITKDGSVVSKIGPAGKIKIF